MQRWLTSIGVALIDAGANPEMARKTVHLLDGIERQYLPVPTIVIEERRTTLCFCVEERELTLIVSSPAAGWRRYLSRSDSTHWRRSRSDGSTDEGTFDSMQLTLIERLFDWLVGDVTSRV